MSQQPLIQPRTLKGFRDYLPEMMIPRERLIETARGVFQSYGYSPIDTPALEYLEILLGKAGEETDKQLYRFQDHGGRAVGLRFDLTVPLARFTAQHLAELGTPFKRYHIASVWRGENTQRGRYREFMQCDFDTIGTESPVADVETALVIHDLLRAIGISDFTIHANNRMVLSGLLETLQLADRTAAILRSLDKLAKIGRHGVQQELVGGVGLAQGEAEQILALADIRGTNEQVLSCLERLLRDSDTGQQGVARLARLADDFQAAGAPPHCLRLDVAIARGLDYYTGTVFETYLAALPSIGSICSGGRYDNLAGLYTRQPLPGIGASLGLDRLLAAMEELGLIESARTTAPVLLVYFDPDRLHDYLRMAALVRAAGIGVELYPDAKKLTQQLKYANRQGFRAALIAGEDELKSASCQVKDLRTGSSSTVSLADEAAALIAELRRILV